MFRVPAAEAAGALAYLDERELPDGAEIVYHRRSLAVRLLDSGRAVQAVAYVANRGCRLYCGRLAPETAARAIARGHGQMGANREYLLNTLAHLRAMGVRDAGLDRIAALLPPAPAAAAAPRDGAATAAAAEAGPEPAGADGSSTGGCGRRSGRRDLAGAA